jgi:hypothetical protein
MGLDILEVLLEVEEAFRVKIPHTEVPKMVTVGHMYRYLVARLDEQGTAWRSGRCASQIAFHQFRRILVDGLGIERGAVRPATPLGQLVGIESRRDLWARIGRAVGGYWPSLDRPRWMDRLLKSILYASVVSIGIVWLVLGLVTVAGADTFAYLVIAVLLLSGLNVFAWGVTTPLATIIPRDCTTVRDCVSVLLRNQSDTILNDPGVRYGPGEVWIRFQGIVSKQLGVPIEDVTESARWVEDLDIS